ncbi:MAG: hypothetical protein AUJ51_05865 [Elusimicrobia bacterium CG1_02_56_21]|nr:MAG: hypothetical protein AUJ51_05865 [Elusimicrobia bacterium CG1_02_56_21]
MTLIFKILGIALLHLVFFACYPGTGVYGNYYLAGSLLVWTIFILFINTSTKLLNLVSGTIGLVINLAAFSLMALAIAATMPQSDKTSVLEKIQSGKYPDRDTVNSGMLRFGVNLNRETKAGVKGLEKELGKAVQKLKED